MHPGVAEVVFVKKDDAVAAYKKYNNRCLDGKSGGGGHPPSCRSLLPLGQQPSERAFLWDGWEDSGALSPLDRRFPGH